MSEVAPVAARPGLALIIDAPAPGEENMRRDVALLDECARGTTTGAVRLYGFRPACLSLGRMQPLSDVNLEACARDGVDIVRRPSGGRAVLHDAEVTYCVVCRASDPVFGGRVLEFVRADPRSDRRRARAARRGHRAAGAARRPPSRCA